MTDDITLDQKISEAMELERLFIDFYRKLNAGDGLELIQAYEIFRKRCRAKQREERRRELAEAIRADV